MFVWKITREGLGGILYLKSLDIFEGSQGGAEDHGSGTKIIAEVVEMDEQNFNDLPEFECFE